MEFNQVSVLWREGERRLAAADPGQRPTLDRVTEEIVSELRRRLGGPFIKRELATVYVEQGTDWCLDIAMRAAPETPAAWDMATVAGAAFGRYVREASDYRAEVARPPGMEPG